MRVYACFHALPVHTHTQIRPTNHSLNHSAGGMFFNKYKMIIYSSYELFCATQMSYVIILVEKKAAVSTSKMKMTLHP